MGASKIAFAGAVHAERIESTMYWRSDMIKPRNTKSCRQTASLELATMVLSIPQYISNRNFCLTLSFKQVAPPLNSTLRRTRTVRIRSSHTDSTLQVTSPVHLARCLTVTGIEGVAAVIDCMALTKILTNFRFSAINGISRHADLIFLHTQAIVLAGA